MISARWLRDLRKQEETQRLFFGLAHAGGADNTLKLWDLHGSDQRAEEVQASSSSALSSMALLQTYPTKATPVFAVKFSHRNLLMGSGALTLRKKHPQS